MSFLVKSDFKYITSKIYLVNRYDTNLFFLAILLDFMDFRLEQTPTFLFCLQYFCSSTSEN